MWLYWRKWVKTIERWLNISAPVWNPLRFDHQLLCVDSQSSQAKYLIPRIGCLYIITDVKPLEKMEEFIASSVIAFKPEPSFLQEIENMAGKENQELEAKRRSIEDQKQAEEKLREKREERAKALREQEMEESPLTQKQDALRRAWLDLRAKAECANQATDSVAKGRLASCKHVALTWQRRKDVTLPSCTYWRRIMSTKEEQWMWEERCVFAFLLVSQQTESILTATALLTAFILTHQTPNNLNQGDAIRQAFPLRLPSDDAKPLYSQPPPSNLPTRNTFTNTTPPIFGRVADRRCDLR
ncbi:hypothetical protein DL98DRAFT_630488 [Cadophora sp. DSE1049]|nr:hypothetical protein DL98DRAFT_630488 [Cadophora sp. DSE1049]